MSDLPEIFAIRPNIAWDSEFFYVRGHIRKDDGTEALVSIALTPEQMLAIKREVSAWAAALRKADPDSAPRAQMGAH